MPRLLRKTPRRQSDPGCCQASADLYEGLQSATPATQIDPGAPKEPRLSRKTPRRQSDPGCRQASADLYEGLESIMPVTQIDPEVYLPMLIKSGRVILGLKKLKGKGKNSNM